MSKKSDIKDLRRIVLGNAFGADGLTGRMRILERTVAPFKQLASKVKDIDNRTRAQNKALRHRLHHVEEHNEILEEMVIKSAHVIDQLAEATGFEVEKVPHQEAGTRVVALKKDKK